MTESQLYELLGRKQAQLESVSEMSNKLIAALIEIKAGKFDLDRLTVIGGNSISISPPAPVNRIAEMNGKAE